MIASVSDCLNMTFKTGLFIGTNPKSTSALFKQLIQQDSVGLNTLYVKLLKNVSRPEQSLVNKEAFRRTVLDFYRRLQNTNIDVRVLSSNIRPSNPPDVVTTKQIEIVYYDPSYSSPMIEDFVKFCVVNKSSICKTVPLPAVNDDYPSPFEDTEGSNTFREYDYVALGGTFDKLHIGHKILLSEAVMRCRKKMTVAICTENMLRGANSYFCPMTV